MKIRQQKVAAQIRRLVSTVLQREVHDPRIDGLITVTKVEVTPDLKEARVYVSILKTHGSVTAVLHGLKSATRRIQNEVAEALPMRIAPHLSFHLDESLKKEAEILQKLDEVARERENRSATTKPQ